MTAEPTLAAFGGAAPGRILKRYFFATRPLFLTASVLPTCLGTAWGARSCGGFDLPVFALAAVAIAAVHAAANVVNDICDDMAGTDRCGGGYVHPFTGGSRFLQNGILTRRSMAGLAAALLAGAAVAGLALVAVRGWGVLGFGLLGLAGGLAYSTPPVRLSARGLGEATVGAMFGVLPVVGAAWLQCGAIDRTALLLSLPVAAWVTAVLLINEIPDTEADAASGKRTLAVRLGPGPVGALYVLLQGAAALATLWLAGQGIVGWAAALAVLAVAGLGVSVGARIPSTPTTAPGFVRLIKATLAVHGLGTLSLAGGVAIG